MVISVRWFRARKVAGNQRKT